MAGCFSAVTPGSQRGQAWNPFPHRQLVAREDLGGPANQPSRKTPCKIHKSMAFNTTICRGTDAGMPYPTHPSGSMKWSQTGT